MFGACYFLNGYSITAVSPSFTHGFNNDTIVWADLKGSHATLSLSG